MSEENRIKTFSKKSIEKALPDEFSSRSRVAFLKGRKRLRIAIFSLCLIISFGICSLLWVNLYLPQRVQKEAKASLLTALNMDQATMVMSGSGLDMLKGRSESLAFKAWTNPESSALIWGLEASWSDPEIIGIIQAGQVSALDNAPDSLVLEWDNLTFQGYFEEFFLNQLGLENLESVEITANGIGVKGKLLMAGKTRDAQMLLIPEAKDGQLVFRLAHLQADAITMSDEEGQLSWEQVITVPGFAWQLPVVNILLEGGLLKLELIPVKNIK